MPAKYLTFFTETINYTESLANRFHSKIVIIFIFVAFFFITIANAPMIFQFEREVHTEDVNMNRRQTTPSLIN